MAGLLYYIPGRKHAELADAAELGLPYAFESGLSPLGIRHNGPDGGAGVVLYDSKRVAKPGYFADEQQWLKIPGNPAGAWVGRYTDEPCLPKPEDVAREEQLNGHLVRLADGQDWLVPVARGMGETKAGERCFYQAVPTRMALNEEGEWDDGEIVQRYRPLWEIACQWWDRLGAVGADDFKETFDFARRADAAVEVLAVNYRLDRAEVSLLGLFDAEAPKTVLDATVDVPAIVEWDLKKKAESAAGD